MKSDISTHGSNIFDGEDNLFGGSYFNETEIDKWIKDQFAYVRICMNRNLNLRLILTNKYDPIAYFLIVLILKPNHDLDLKAWSNDSFFWIGQGKTAQFRRLNFNLLTVLRHVPNRHRYFISFVQFRVYKMNLLLWKLK